MSERIHAITMPRWGMTMTEGTVAGWIVPEGGTVRAGQDLIEIETTKITNVMEATNTGILRRRVADEGSVAPVGALLGVLADEDVAEDEIDTFVAAYKQHEGEIEQDALPSAQPKIVAAGDYRLNVLSVGDAGSQVLLVHGFGGDLNAWAFNQDALADGHRVHAVDLPAHGVSSPAAGIGSVDELATALSTLLDALDVEQVHLVGHSLGGAVASMIAKARPQLVASLCLIAPVGFGPEIDAEYIDGFLKAERRKSMKEVLARLYADPERISSDMVENVLRFKRLDGVPEALATIATGFVQDGRQSVDLRGVLSDLHVPVLVLWGENDQVIPSDHTSGLPDHVRVEIIPQAAHMPQVEMASAVNGVIRAHIAAADARS